MNTHGITLESGKSHAVGKIVCVGRNYAEHARELGNAIPDEPLLFMKPVSALVPLQPGFSIPDNCGECHIETEIALLIGDTIDTTTTRAMNAIQAVGIALDLTLRDLQGTLKKAGQPWEKAKAFDGSCPVSIFIDAQRIEDWNTLELELLRNGARQQHGTAAEMLVGISDLLGYIVQWFTLRPGDLVLTGTPAGVCALADGDQLSVRLNGGRLLKEHSTVSVRHGAALP